MIKDIESENFVKSQFVEGIRAGDVSINDMRDFDCKMQELDRKIDDARRRRDGSIKMALQAKRDFVHSNLTK